MQWFSETSQWDPGLQSSRLKERIQFILFPFPFKCIFSSLFQIVVIEDAYDAVSASVIIWVPESGESKSGQMVSEKVKWS